MRKRKIFITIVLILLGYFGKTQTENKAEPLLHIEGQIAITTNGKAVWYNMGGPTLKFNFRKFAIAISMLPSLKFEDDAPKPFVVPILGVGPQVYFLKNKRAILSFPCYYIASRNSWELSGGVGYVLTKPKK